MHLISFVSGHFDNDVIVDDALEMCQFIEDPISYSLSTV